MGLFYRHLFASEWVGKYYVVLYYDAKFVYKKPIFQHCSTTPLLCWKIFAC